MLKQFSIILGIFFLGELIQKVSGMLIPGNVIGMLILFFGLYSGVIKLDMIGKISDFFLENLAFFFLPAGVSLITCFTLLEGKWTAILIVSLTSTVVTLAVTGLTVQLVKRSLAKKPAEAAYCVLNADAEDNDSRKGNKSRSETNVKKMHAFENGTEEVS